VNVQKSGRTCFDVINYMTYTRVLRQICEQRRRLFIAYQDATACYSGVLRQLVDAAATVTRTEFEILNRRVKAARKLCIDARDRLDKHNTEHQC